MYEEIAREGCENARNGVSLLGFRFAFMPTYCRCCEKVLWLTFYYGMSGWRKIMYRYGPCNNDHHCMACHNKMIKEDRYCTDCHSAYASK